MSPQTTETTTSFRDGSASLLVFTGDIDAYCTEECPCGEGEGDCDTSAQCAGGLVCEQEYVLGVGRACPSWMRPDATCCYAQGHGSGRDRKYILTTA